MPLQIASRNAGDVTIITIAGEVKHGDLDGLRNTFRSALERGARKLLFNMTHVTAVDEAGIDELRSLDVAAGRSGAKLKLYGLPQRAVELLVISRLLTVLDIYENEADALASFGA